jgi:hypothetical protein
MSGVCSASGDHRIAGGERRRNLAGEDREQKFQG